MKCPLFVLNDRRNHPGDAVITGDCLKEKCAWWDEEKNACSIKVIAKSLDRLLLKTN